VNGPNGADVFSDGLDGFQDGMVHCSAKRASVAGKHVTFDGSGSRYLDDVRAWQTNEPALDMTGSAIAATAAQLSN
jgi:endoglucanase